MIVECGHLTPPVISSTAHLDAVHHTHDKVSVKVFFSLVIGTFYFFAFFPPLLRALLSADLAFLAFLFLHAANLSPGTKGFTAMAALLLSAALPISQLASLYMYLPGMKR